MYNLQYIINKIEELCNNEGITVAELLRRCNLPHNTFINMKNGKNPRFQTIVIIAEYFKISLNNFVVDYK